MNLKSTLTLTAIGFAPLAMAATSAKPKTSAKQKPNIIFFLMDDMGYSELGCFGQQKIETPNIDALAANGKMLTQHYSGSPVSAPSRCVLLTGQHTGHSYIRGNDEDGERGDVWSHQAMFDNPGLEGQHAVPADTRTLSGMLQDAGYTTACIGKWGLGAPGSVSEPNNMGFDFFYGYNCQRQAHTYYPTHLYKNRERELLGNAVLQPGTKLDKDADPLDLKSYAKYSQKTYAPDRMFEETMGFLEENKDKPFFLWWTTPMPHVSLQAPEDMVTYYVDKFGDEKPFLGDMYFPSRYPHATYAAMVSYIDKQVGAVVEKLKKDGIYDNTIIVFTSDNGPSFNGGTDSPWFDSAKPFKSEFGWGKCSVMEGGMRVPTIVSWPGRVDAGSKSDMVSASWDWVPTLLDMAGSEDLIPASTDGLSLKPMLTGKGKQKEHEFLYWEYPEMGGQMAVRAGDWKLVVKNIKKEANVALYNIATDPREQSNVASENPDVVARLKEIAAQSHQEPLDKLFILPLPLK